MHTANPPERGVPPRPHMGRCRQLCIVLWQGYLSPLSLLPYRAQPCPVWPQGTPRGDRGLPWSGRPLEPLHSEKTACGHFTSTQRGERLTVLGRRKSITPAHSGGRIHCAPAPAWLAAVRGHTCVLMQEHRGDWLDWLGQGDIQACASKGVLCVGGGGRGLWDPKVDVPKMPQRNLFFSNLNVFPLYKFG